MMIYMASEFEINFEYEDFMLEAFSLDNKRGMIDRYEDPAGLAATDSFADGSIYIVKAAVSYAMAIFNNHILLEKVPYSKGLTVQDHLEEYIKKVFEAENKVEIYNLIKQYKKEKSVYENN